MRLLLTVPLGVLIGISLGAVGGGGSILAVPVLVYAVGLEPKSATTASPVVVGAAALGGMVGHWRAGRVRIGAGITFGLAGLGGSVLGSLLNRSVNPQVLLLAFSVLIVIAAWSMWSRRHPPVVATDQVDAGVAPGPTSADGCPTGDNSPSADRPAVETSDSRNKPGLVTIAKVLAAGSVVGLVTGFFGVGGGFIAVPALVLALGYAMPVAVGTSLLVIAINSGTALVSRMATSGVDWHVALPFAGAAVVGAIVGKRIHDKLPAASLVRWFVVLLLAIAAYTALRAALALWGG